MNKHTHLGILRHPVSGMLRVGVWLVCQTVRQCSVSILEVKLCLIIKTPNQLHMQPMNQIVNSLLCVYLL